MAKRARETNSSWLWRLCCDWKYFSVMFSLLMIFEVAASIFIVIKVPCESQAWLAPCKNCIHPAILFPDTEIDWIAYMQEVRGFLGGDMNYLNLKGDTGPLVYPAGFVYLYSLLNWATDDGSNIRLAQWVFTALYLATSATTLYIYKKAQLCPPWVAALLVLSRRVHSIFMLRLFNDGVAMLLLYVSMALYMHRRKLLACVFFSLAVSIKMNIFLFAPGFLLIMLRGSGLVGTVQQLTVCAAVQLVLGAPFLATFPIEYLSKAFELSRVFTYKWTVNFRFLSEEQFVSKPLALALLALHAALLVVFAVRWAAVAPAVETVAVAPRPASKTGTLRGADGAAEASKQGSSGASCGQEADSAYFVCVMFISNFIGVAVARTLHYQFYSWYWHSLPALAWLVFGGTTSEAVWNSKSVVWHGTRGVFVLGVLGCIEYAFNVFPATPLSSLVLQGAHALLLAGLLLRSPASLLNSAPHSKLD